ncbi:MAG: hypothetical protein EHM23_13285 [Acidobacteria bacterium]|nr:MAG: hypothetical protein EHM23_13285 [Acidobacteriota bacterium]
MSACAVILLSFLIAATPTPTPPQKSGATLINEALVQLQAPKPSKEVQKFQLKEADINEFIAVAIQSKKRLGVKKIQLDVAEAGRVAAVATINMDDVKLDNTGVWLFKKVLSGTQVLKAQGKVVRTGGKARYELEKAEFNGVWVPAWLASAVVSYVGKNQPPHVDITEEFDLPFGITGLVFHSDRVEITR